MRSLLILALASACSLRAADRATLAVSAAALACDWSQTRSAASRGWSSQHEANPIMGERPSVGSVDGYFATVMVADALVWLALPERLRWLAPASVIGVEVQPVSHNLGTVGGLCGL